MPAAAAYNVGGMAIRHSVITNTLRRTYSDQTESVSIDKLSYAGQRDPHCSSDIQWTSIDAILGEKLMEMLNIMFV